MKVVFEIDPKQDLKVFKLLTEYLETKDIPSTPEQLTESLLSQAEPDEVVVDKAKPEEIAKYTADQMRRAFMAKNNEENRPKLKAILDEFGTANISGLDPQHYEAAMEKLEAIS